LIDCKAIGEVNGEVMVCLLWSVVQLHGQVSRWLAAQSHWHDQRTAGDCLHRRASCLRVSFSVQWSFYFSLKKV